MEDNNKYFIVLEFTGNEEWRGDALITTEFNYIVDAMDWYNKVSYFDNLLTAKLFQTNGKLISILK